MIKTLGWLLLLSALPILCDPLTYSSTCSSYGVPPVTGTSSCFSNPPIDSGPESNYTSASTQVGVSIGFTNVVNISQSLLALDSFAGPSTNFRSFGTSSQSQASYSTTLTTVGSGGGFVHATVPIASAGSSDGSYGVAQAALSGAALIPGYSAISGGCAAFPNESECLTGGGPLGPFFNTYYYANDAPYIPIRLGVPFTLAVSVNGAAISDPENEVDYASLHNYVEFQFQVFGSDLTTPVLVQETPEPSTFGLMGIAAAGFLVIRRLSLSR